ncbi:MAG: LamG-like jellyroll fold domain-containing protein, partial [Prevotella sp.]
GKDLTIDLMVKPAETGRDMPLFSHGTNGQKLQLWLTKDFYLKAVVNDQTFTSDSVIGKNAFRQVALTISQQDSTLTFYKGGVRIGSRKLTSLYNGTGTLIFGRTNELDRSQSTYYEGRMMEARLWYSAMDGGLIGTTYGGKRLTGYESNLVDYYPMNEGSGDYVTDHTQGANARLMGASWAIPRGLSLHLEKADKGVLLDKNAINRTAEHDYTLMFWFKTDAEGRGTLLSNGRGLKEDNGAENQFHIGFEADTLKYRSNGFAAEVPGDWSDGQWHNFAMTVNRARNVANIYVDKELRTTFEADSLGGISGGYPLIGASRYDVVNEKDTLLRQDGLTPLKGNVDELLFFAQALPQQLIKTYASKSPNGDEAGLLTYLSFDRIERQSDNDLELVPYAYSKKIYLDEKGQPRYQLDPLTKEPTGTLVRDYLFVDDEAAVLTHFDRTQAAPVVPYEEVKNLKFGFIGKGNQLLVELDENAARLNHRNIYVTVRDIEDKNGNMMASPQTACYYVTNSSLQWLI